MIRFACPGCSSTFSVDDSKAGKSGKCPKCQAAFIIPQAEAPAAPPPLPVPVPPPVPVPQTPAVDPNAPVEIDPCPKCQTKLSVATSDLGNDVECPYCKTVFASTRAGTRPPAPPAPPPGRKSSAEFEFSGKAKPRRERDEEDEDDRPRRRRTEDNDDDRPSKRRSARRDEDDDDDNRPSRRGRPPVSRRDDDDDDDRPSRRGRSRRDDDDDDDDYDDRPRRRSRSRRRSGGSGERSGAVTAASVMTIVVGVLWLIGAGLVFFGSAFLFSAMGGLPRGFGPQAQARDAAEGAIVGLTLCCGVPLLLMAVLHMLGGVLALQRKTAGRIIVIICASLALLLGLLSLYSMFRVFFVLPRFPPFEIVLYQLLNLFMTLGYGIFAMIVMCRADYADEFD